MMKKKCFENCLTAGHTYHNLVRAKIMSIFTENMSQELMLGYLLMAFLNHKHCLTIGILTVDEYFT